MKLIAFILCKILDFLRNLVLLIVYLISLMYWCLVFVIIKLFHSNSLLLIKPGIETCILDSTGSANVIYVFKCKGTANIVKIVDKLCQILKYETKTISGGEALVPYRPFQKLSYTVQQKYFCWCWKIDNKFQAENHLKLETIIDRDLDFIIREKCENLVDKYFTTGIPWWDVTVVQNTDEYAIIWNIHHVYGDGTILTQLFRYGLADHPFPIKVEPLEWNRKHVSSFMCKVKIFLETIFFSIILPFAFVDVVGLCLKGQNFIQVRFVVDH